MLLYLTTRLLAIQLRSQNSIAEIRGAFADAGLTVSQWADAHGFRRENVYAVLAGRAKGRRGEAHRIAQALGLKAASRTALARKLTAAVFDHGDQS